ncbi:proximal tubules-expressed gene protein-like [Gastrophryne carolinensis]
MGCLQLAILLLLSLGQISCQSGTYKEELVVPRWGRGLIAVACFLALVFICYVANKAWDRRSGSHLESVSMKNFEDGVISSSNTGCYISQASDNGGINHIYENPVLITDDEVSTARASDNGDINHTYKNQKQVTDNEFSTAM